MDKAELVASVADKSGLSKQDAAKSVDAVVAAITDALKSGDSVRLVGFGAFSVVDRAASKGRNPRTGEEIDIPASKKPKFAAGAALKAAIS